jgi:hypothetical protein
MSRIQLHWAQRKHTKTVRLNEGSGNIATMYTAPSYKAFTTFCSMCEVEVDEDDPIINMETHLIPDHENEDIDGPVHQPEAPDKPISFLITKMKTLMDLFINQRHQIPHLKGWIGLKLQIHQSHLILMQLTALTCQSSLKMKRILLSTRNQPQNSFAGITS